MPVIVEQRLPTAFHRMLRPGLRIIRILVGQAKPIGDPAGRSLQTLQTLRPVGPTHLRDECDARTQAGHLALVLVGRVRRTRGEVEHAPVHVAVVDHAHVQVEFRADGHILRRVLGLLVRARVRRVRGVPCGPRLDGRMEPVAVGRALDGDRQADGTGAGVHGRRLAGRLQQTVAGVHLRDGPVDGFRGEFRLVAGRMVHPAHLLRVERDLVLRVGQFEPEADARAPIIIHGRVGGERVLVVVGHRIVGADDVVGFVLVVAARVVLVERRGAGDAVDEPEPAHGGAVRVEHVVDGHVRRGLTRIRLRSGLRGRTGAGLFVRPGSGLVAGTGVGFRRGLVAARGRLHVGFGLDSRGRAHGRIVRIRGGHDRRA